jgi:hypothetical protein
MHRDQPHMSMSGTADSRLFPPLPKGGSVRRHTGYELVKQTSREPQANLVVGCKALLDGLLHGLRKINREALETELRPRTNPPGGWHT